MWFKAGVCPTNNWKSQVHSHKIWNQVTFASLNASFCHTYSFVFRRYQLQLTIYSDCCLEFFRGLILKEVLHWIHPIDHESLPQFVISLYHFTCWLVLNWLSIDHVAINFKHNYEVLVTFAKNLWETACLFMYISSCACYTVVNTSCRLCPGIGEFSCSGWSLVSQCSLFTLSTPLILDVDSTCFHKPFICHFTVSSDLGKCALRWVKAKQWKIFSNCF